MVRKEAFRDHEMTLDELITSEKKTFVVMTRYSYNLQLMFDASKK